ncbi:hypothetical protein [Roseofilum casamattae]|uniref:Gas vesicle protein n=1 Tax=Roseofilum casamattae BLCC-M143 TaxID=3022442 RepID=A0ABT7BTK9_9CYAN|nr:hypothetical protein [Roseofilum casamattae]MDJ1182519.1 hypothetical protein [Roseofilum casamattae BLCC-M143]
MTQSNNNFATGFLLGSICGGIVGGILGTTLISRRSEIADSEESLNGMAPNRALKNMSVDLRTDEQIEAARRRLEAKIAQLNETIDDVRDQLGSMNSAPSESESSS